MHCRAAPYPYHCPGIGYRHLILRKRLVRILVVGRLLFLAAGAGGLSCWRSWAVAIELSGAGEAMALWAGHGLAGVGSAFLAAFALLDARSRFQDYKRAKDLFFENGIHPRTARLFIHSKCQRDAALAAARDLGLKERLAACHRASGYRWYHILPDALFKRPGILLTRRYWARTLLAPSYTSSIFSW